jgi:hypothetical protein
MAKKSYFTKKDPSNTYILYTRIKKRHLMNDDKNTDYTYYAIAIGMLLAMSILSLFCAYFL